jgi:hypothetical protein
MGEEKESEENRRRGKGRRVEGRREGVEKRGDLDWHDGARRRSA